MCFGQINLYVLYPMNYTFIQNCSHITLPMEHGSKVMVIKQLAYCSSLQSEQVLIVPP